MIQFRQAAYLLFGKNVTIVSKRSLFSDRFALLEGFRMKRLTTRAKSEIEFMHEIQNATIPKLLHSTKQWTLATTSKSAHINLLHQSLYRLHDNCAEIQSPEDVEQFNQLGQMTMRLFDHFELPEKALQVNHINPTAFFSRFPIETIPIIIDHFSITPHSSITNLIIVLLIRHRHRSF